MSAPDTDAECPRPPSGSTASHNEGVEFYSKMTLSPAGDGTAELREQPGPNGVRWKPWSELLLEAEGLLGGETSSRFLRLGKIGFVPLRSNSRNVCGTSVRGIWALRCDDLSGISRLSALLKLTEYTGEPLWLTGTVSKIC
jgi:hypothetical protein